MATVGVFGALDHVLDIEKFVPSDAADHTKTAVELAEFVMLGIGTGAIGKAAGSGGKKLISKFFTEKATKFRLPEKIIVKEQLAKEVFGIKGNEVGLSRFIEIADKPAFAKLKKMLKIKEASKAFPKDPILRAMQNTERIIEGVPPPKMISIIPQAEITPAAGAMLKPLTQGKKANSISSKPIESPLENITAIEGKTPLSPLKALGKEPKQKQRISSKGGGKHSKEVAKDAGKKIDDNISGTPTDPVAILDSSDGKFRLPELTVNEKFRLYVEDYNIRLKTLNREIERVAGSKLPEYYDLYAQKDMLPRVTSDLVKRVRQQKSDMAKKVAEDGLYIKEVDNYLHALHAKERNAAMLEFQKSLGKKGKLKPGLSGMTDEAAAEILAKAKPEYKKYAKISRELSDELLEMQVEAGLLSRKDVQRIKAKYKNYVPLFRDVQDGAVGIGRGLDIRGKEIKRAKGSEQEVLSILGNLFAQKERVIVRIAKNDIGKNIKSLVDEYPFMSDIFKIEKQQFVPRFNSQGELQYLDPKFKFADNVMGFKIEGKQFFATIKDPSIARALMDMNVQRVGPFLKHSRLAISLWSSMKTVYPLS